MWCWVRMWQSLCAMLVRHGDLWEMESNANKFINIYLPPSKTLIRWSTGRLFSYQSYIAVSSVQSVKLFKLFLLLIKLHIPLITYSHMSNCAASLLWLWFVKMPLNLMQESLAIEQASIKYIYEMDNLCHHFIAIHSDFLNLPYLYF